MGSSFLDRQAIGLFHGPTVWKSTPLAVLLALIHELKYGLLTSGRQALGLPGVAAVPQTSLHEPYQVTWIVADPKTGTVWVSRTDSQPCWIWWPFLEIDLCTLANGTLV